MPVATIDEYLAPLPEDKRAALRKMRRLIHAAAPRAVEGISYGVPTFKYNGRMLGSFGAAAKHCALYGFTSAPKALLKGYDTSPGTIRFPADKPLPAALVKQLVKYQIARIEAAEAVKSKANKKPVKRPVKKAVKAGSKKITRKTPK
jgi:uncharacterized protein YdhG (YjbR/CyaY superfamily)